MASLEAIFKGLPKTGPPSLKSHWARLRYREPEGLTEAFNEALKVINSDVKSAEELASKTDSKELKYKLLSKSQRHLPNVKFNHLIRSKDIDLNAPVYKALDFGNWERQKLPILMQRLEQHHVIPDTMPTLDPKADVNVEFLTPTSRPIQPGQFISTDVSSHLPRITMRDWESDTDSNSLYTVVIMNPDIPNLENDRYTNYAHFVAYNLEASTKKPAFDLQNKQNVVLPYIPPHPEKNGPSQRICIWVFRQTGKLNDSTLERNNFNIREFSEKLKLTAIGASVFRSAWDVHTEEVREKYGLPRGNVYFRARTAKPEEALLHIRERPKWMKVDGLEE